MSATIDAPSNAELADVLDKAEAHIERVGHHKNYLYDEKQADQGIPIVDCPTCVWGAIHYAIHGEPRPSSTGTHEEFLLGQMAGDEVRKHLHVQTLVAWNDAKGRQKRQVVKALRDTAAALRTGAAS